MLKKNIVSGAITQVARIVLNFAISILSARALGSTLYGQISYFFVIFNVLGEYGPLGITSAISFFYKKDNGDDDKKFSSNITYLVLNCGLLLIIFFLPFVKKILLPDMSYGFVALGMLYVLVVYLYNALTAYCVGDEKVYVSNRMWLLGLVLATAIMVISACMGKFTSTIYIIGKIAEYFLPVAALFVVIKKKYRPALDVRFLWKELKYGNIIFWASLFGYLNYRIDQIMIKYELGDSELGVYSVAVALAELVFLIPNSFTSAITGRLLNANSEDEHTKSVLCLVIKGCFYLCIGISIVAVFCTPLITVVYGEQYAGAKRSFLILLVGVCFASLGKVMYPFYTMTGRPKVHLWVTLVVMISNIVLNFIFIPRYGIDGAALGSTLSYILYGIIYLFLYRYKEKIPFKKMLLLSRDDIRVIKGGMLNENRVL